MPIHYELPPKGRTTNAPCANKKIVCLDRKKSRAAAIGGVSAQDTSRIAAARKWPASFNRLEEDNRRTCLSFVHRLH